MSQSVLPDDFDWHQTIMSQYANSPIMLAYLDFIQQNYDPSGDIDMFYLMVWDVATAVGWGLDVWGRIVGVSRTLQVFPKFFGFVEATTASADPFNVSPFYAGGPLSGGFPLSDDAFRTFILAKAAANISDCSIPSINQILRTLFPGIICYVTDGEDMTMKYTFVGVVLTPVQVAIASSGVLPKPAGVSVTVEQI